MHGRSGTSYTIYREIYPFHHEMFVYYHYSMNPNTNSSSTRSSDEWKWWAGVGAQGILSPPLSLKFYSSHHRPLPSSTQHWISYNSCSVYLFNLWHAITHFISILILMYMLTSLCLKWCRPPVGDILSWQLNPWQTPNQELPYEIRT